MGDSFCDCFHSRVVKRRSWVKESVGVIFYLSLLFVRGREPAFYTGNKTTATEKNVRAASRAADREKRDRRLLGWLAALHSGNLSPVVVSGDSFRTQAYGFKFICVSACVVAPRGQARCTQPTLSKARAHTPALTDAWVFISGWTVKLGKWSSKGSNRLRRPSWAKRREERGFATE